MLFFEPEALFLYLDQRTAEEKSGEERVKGYRVKIEYGTLPEDIAKAKDGTIYTVVSDSDRKKKK